MSFHWADLIQAILCLTLVSFVLPNLFCAHSSWQYAIEEWGSLEIEAHRNSGLD